MVKRASESYAHIWDCREIKYVPHTQQLVHDKEIEDGLPNYQAQQEGDIRVTICSKCHPQIPGHIVNIEPEDIEQFFDIPDVSALFDALPEGISSTGTSRKIRERIMHYCVQDRYNPCRGHAGNTLRASLGFQFDRPEWQPDNELDFDTSVEEAYRNRYNDHDS